MTDATAPMSSHLSFHTPDEEDRMVDDALLFARAALAVEAKAGVPVAQAVQQSAQEAEEAARARKHAHEFALRLRILIMQAAQHIFF